MNYRTQIERFRQIMKDYPVGSKKHELAKQAFAAYVAEQNKLAMGVRQWKA